MSLLCVDGALNAEIWHFYESYQTTLVQHIDESVPPAHEVKLTTDINLPTMDRIVLTTSLRLEEWLLLGRVTSSLHPTIF